MIPKNFKGAAHRLGDQDIAQVAHDLGCSEDTIHAVLDVEARGSGFDDHGRPTMLFEPHVFYRNLKGAEQDRAVRAGLAYPKWRRNYPKDSYPRLEAARAINAESAYRAASWGLSQILGENFKEAGFPSAAAMVEACCESEGRQLAMMATLMRAWGLQTALRNRQWATIARRWNGPGYADNHYDTRLAARFAWWQTKPDTPWEPKYAAIETIENDQDAPGVVNLPPADGYVPLPTISPAPLSFAARVSDWWHGLFA